MGSSEYVASAGASSISVQMILEVFVVMSSSLGCLRTSRAANVHFGCSMLLPSLAGFLGPERRRRGTRWAGCRSALEMLRKALELHDARAPRVDGGHAVEATQGSRRACSRHPSRMRA